MLEIRDLKYGYDYEKVIIDIEQLEIKKSSFNCILGSNGSGKSTLCMLIANVLEKDQGTITLDGEKLGGKDVSIVFQNPMDQFVRPTVYDDLAFGLENMNMPVAKIKELITEYADKFNISHLLDRSINNLSGGEKQRVAIISNIMLKPKVLIMDEATDMLDPITRIEMIRLIKEFVIEHQMIIIYITHDMDLAFSTNNLIIIKDGKVDSVGTPLTIFNNDDIVARNRLLVPYSVRLMKRICGEYCYTDIVSFKEMYEIDVR